ncbi:MAG: oxidoreductase [Sphingomonas sp.]|nr:oxidoreductase [Sphingomonas sp.]
MAIRAGLVGYGLAGSVFHAPLISACERMELAAVLTSRDAPNRVASIDELIERSDMVVVASPNTTHFDLAKHALEAGRHVVVDKPLTVSVNEADQLIALATEQQRVLTVFHNRRWDSDYLTVRELLPRLGELSLFEANWDRFRPQMKRGWREQLEPGSGLFNDLGPHLIDQALQLFGMPEAVEAEIATQRPDAVVDDCFDVTLHYASRDICLRASSLMATPRPRFAIHGTRGSFVKHGLDPQEAQLKAGVDPRSPEYGIDPQDGTLARSDGTSERMPTKRGNYLAFYDAVAAAIHDGAPVPVAAQDARDGLMLIDLARRASELGQRLPVPAANSPEV